jgi:galactokinase
LTTEIFEGIAPGRLDVMGGIADYSGSLVLQKPIKEKTTVKFSFRNDGLVIARTFSKEEDEQVFIIEYQALLMEDGKVDFDKAREVFKSKIGGTWAAYIVGCLLVLQKEKGIIVEGGEFEVRSEIPEGKGVSSSAALEIATMKALEKAFGLQFTGTEMAVMAQIVENRIVGAPCGLMDQLSCCFGKSNELLPIVCQPDKLLDSISLPKNIHFIGIDSGTRHHVGGNSYSDVRKAAFMGYSIIANFLGVANNEIIKARKSALKSHLPFSGFLTNISKDEWLEKFTKVLPNHMYGHEFMANFENTIDPITSINPDKFYAIKACSSHPVLENARIHEFYQLLLKLNNNETDQPILVEMGQLMYQSHNSYSSVQLGSSATDRIVEMVKENHGNGVYGAKITGGGSGGTVCILAAGDAGLETVKKIHREYQIEIGKELKIFI